jgi:translation elongation factor EF-1beta
VTLQAVVSIGKLVAYTQSKGGTTELAGATFAMNMKMKELNKKNENIALNNLLLQLKEIVPQAFDYSINIEDPVAFGVNYHCKAMVEVKPNSNAKSMAELIESTLKSLSLSGSETEEYRNTNIGFTQIYTAPKYVEAKTNCFGELTNDEEKKLEHLKLFDRRDVSLREKEIKELSQRGEDRKNNPDFSLRTTDTDFFMALNNLLVEAICGFTIADDNGEYQFSAHLADENWKSLGRDCSTSSKGRFGINVFGSGSIREIIKDWHENDTGMGWCMINVQTSNTTGNSSRFQRLRSTNNGNTKASLFPLSLNGYWNLEGYLNYTAEEIGKISKISVYGLKMK